MESMIKKAIRVGNSSGVLLPKSWASRKVKVELVEENIIDEIFEKLRKKNLLSDVIGVYLVGSYARGEENLGSDIDVLVVTGENDLLLNEGEYEILLISRNKLERNLEKSLYVYSMVREAKTILNEELIMKYRNRKFNYDNKLIKEIRKIIKIDRESVELSGEFGTNVQDGVAYSLILRLRELYLIKCILKSREYTKKEFLESIDANGFMEYYGAYVRIKRDGKAKNNLDVENGKRLISYIEKEISNIENEKRKKS